MFKIYSVPEDCVNIRDNMIYKNVSSMNREECIVRIYIIKGIDLQSKDSNGKVNHYVHLIFLLLKCA